MKEMNREEIKAVLLSKVQELYKELNRIPDRYDWIIYTDLKWKEGYSTWGSFLIEAGIIEKPSNGRVYLPKPDGEKLCEVLRTIEKRLGRQTNRYDWDLLVDPGKLRSFESYFGPPRHGGTYSTSEIEWGWADYLNNEYLNDDGWTSFRYAAGLNEYTSDKLISLGVEKLKSLSEKGRRSICSKSIWPTRGLYKKSRSFFRPSEMDDEELKARLIFSRDLPHLAIRDYFGTFRHYVEVIGNQLAKRDAFCRMPFNREVMARTFQQEDIEILIASLEKMANNDSSRKELLIGA